jgi:hypothetical protein
LDKYQLTPVEVSLKVCWIRVRKEDVPVLNRTSRM